MAGHPGHCWSVVSQALKVQYVGKKNSLACLRDLSEVQQTIAGKGENHDAILNRRREQHHGLPERNRVQSGPPPFDSQAAFAKPSADWPRRRFVEIWNSISDNTEVSKIAEEGGRAYLESNPATSGEARQES